MRRLGQLVHDRGGASAVEFALVLPVLLIALLGLLDLGYNMYTATLLEGAIQASARDSTLEGASTKTAAIDTQVTKAVLDIAPGATLTFKRTAYPSFSSANKPEDFTDTNGNGKCDAGEPYEDTNENGSWDTDQGTSGSGGSRDVVIYLVTVTYPRPFPIASLFGASSTYTMKAQTVLTNQPWDNVQKVAPVRNCK
jgi:Flp pilus assembly protein TadG